MPSEGEEEHEESLDSFEKKSQKSQKTDKGHHSEGTHHSSHHSSEGDEGTEHEGSEEEEHEHDEGEEEEDDLMRKLREQAEAEDAMLEEEYYDDEYGEGEEEGHHEGDESEEEEDDMEDDMEDYEDGAWEDDDDEEESEESMNDDQQDGKSDDEVKSDVAQTVSTVSNEVEVKSELEFYDLDRQPAHVFPEPPWGGVRDQAKQLAISCLLPVLLVVLLCYALIKSLQCLAQCMIDGFNVGTAFVWLLIRLALSPLFIIWKLFTPTYLQKYVSSQYDQKVGRRIRRVLALKRRVIAAITDLPNVVVACSFAAFDTCFTPARANCGIFLWTYCGQYIDKFIFKPVADANINRLTRRRKNHVYSNKGDHDIKMIKKKQEQIARKQKREARDKAKKLRVKKRMQEMNVQLQVAADHPAAMMGTTHQFKDKNATEMISRTMIIERRYAVAIGFFWCVVGFAMLIKVLDGTTDERCTICNTNNELQMLICRHGIGRDCAFNLHRIEISVAITLMSMGVVLLVYATFLYKPRGLSEEAAEKERAEKLAAAEKRVASAKRMEDADMLIIQDVVERMKKATVPRVAKKVYLKSPCRGIYLWFSRRSHRPLKFILTLEEKNRLADRSIAFQERLINKALSFFGSRVPFMESSEDRMAREEMEENIRAQEDLEAAHAEKVAKVTSNAQKKASMMMTKRVSVLTPHYHKHSKSAPGWVKVLYILFLPCLAFLFGIGIVCSKTPIPRLCGKYVTPRLRRCSRCCRRCFSRKSGPFGGDMVDHHLSETTGVSGGGRAGRDGGVSTLEDVLRRFGFLTEEEQAALDAEKKGGQATKIESERKKLVVEKPDPLGHVETQREAGIKDVDKEEVDEEVPRHVTLAEAHESIKDQQDDSSSGSGSGSTSRSIGEVAKGESEMERKDGSESGSGSAKDTQSEAKTNPTDVDEGSESEE